MPRISANQKLGVKIRQVNRVLIPCTCQRTGQDITDLYAIIEERNVRFKGGDVSYTKRTEYGIGILVCLRFGCLGRRRTQAPWVLSLPVISWNEYVTLKEVWLYNGALDHAKVLENCPDNYLGKVRGRLPAHYKRGYRSGETTESHNKIVKKSKGRRNAKGHIIDHQYEKPIRKPPVGPTYIRPPGMPHPSLWIKMDKEDKTDDIFMYPDNYPSAREIKERIL